MTRADIAVRRAALVARANSQQEKLDDFASSVFRPNHVGSRRFTEAELDRIAAAVARNSGIEKNHHCFDLEEGPLAPPSAVREHMGKLASEMGPSCGGHLADVPEWCRCICRNPAAFKGVALFDPENPDGVAFLCTFVKERPHRAEFLELRPLPIVMPEMISCEEQWFPPLARREFDWYEPLHILPEHAIPFGIDSDIHLLRGVRFDATRLVSNRQSMSFKKYTEWLSAPHDDADSSSKRCSLSMPKVKPDAIADLLAQHEWLDEEDLRDGGCYVSKKQRTGSGSASMAVVPALTDEVSDMEEEASGESDGDDDADDPDLEEELSWIRTWLASADEDETHFHVKVLGGQWTKANTGEACDFVIGKCRAGIAKDWCRHTDFPQSRRFSIRRYSAEGANWLAKEFSRRGNFFCRQYVVGNSEGPGWSHSATSNSAYAEKLDFLDWAAQLELDDPCLHAVMLLRDICPQTVVQ